MVNPEAIINDYMINGTVSSNPELSAVLGHIMGDKLATVAYRERATAAALEYEHHRECHGIDATDNKRHIGVEIKTEQADTNFTAERKQSSQMSGTGAFGSSKHEYEVADQFNEENEFMINHSFFSDGKLLGIFEFSSTHPTVRASIMSYVAARDDEGSKGSIKYTGGNWLNEELPGRVKVRWINKELVDEAFAVGNLSARTAVGKLLRKCANSANVLKKTPVEVDISCL